MDVRQLAEIIESTYSNLYLNGGGKIAFHRCLHEILQEIPESGLSIDSFYQRLLPFVAAVGDGHTRRSPSDFLPLLACPRLLGPVPLLSAQFGRRRRSALSFSSGLIKSFLARASSPIPDKGQVMVRYFGLYINAHRGKIRKANLAAFSLRIVEDKPVPSKGWAEMIRKVDEVDPMICPQCGGKMRIIAFLTDYAVKDKIINHLKLAFVAQRLPLLLISPIRKF